MSKKNVPDGHPGDFSFLTNPQSPVPNPPQTPDSESLLRANLEHEPTAAKATPDPAVETVRDEQPVLSERPVEPQVANRDSESVTTKPVTKVASKVESPASSSETAAANEATLSNGTRGRPSSGLLGYAIAVTLLLLFCLVTGRLTFRANHTLESLPDLRPLGPNEFLRVPDGTELPTGHLLKPGESKRFGDVVITPVRITREPLQFEGFLNKTVEESLTTSPVLQLWVRFENVSDEYSFPPFDSGLMSHRSPPAGTDQSTIANSFLHVNEAADAEPIRILNFLQSLDSNFLIIGQNSGKVLAPGESMEACFASSTDIQNVKLDESTTLTWRIQFRKGVHVGSGHGVTTLVDVAFTGSDITSPAPVQNARSQHLEVVGMMHPLTLFAP
jgi:hypothetical protein